MLIPPHRPRAPFDPQGQRHRPGRPCGHSGGPGPGQGRRRAALARVTALLTAGGWPGVWMALPPPMAAAWMGVSAIAARAAADPAAPGSRAQRPADLLILQRSAGLGGGKEVGLYGARADPREPGLWSVQIWEETLDRVTIATDRIRCSSAAPMRITGSGGRVMVRELNPGGPIHAANRLDHLIWWAVCHPSLAGRDPATLGTEARRLGFDGLLPERQQVLQLPPAGPR